LPPNFLKCLLAKLVTIGLLFNAELVFFGGSKSRVVLIFKVEIVCETFDKVETEFVEFLGLVAGREVVDKVRAGVVLFTGFEVGLNILVAGFFCDVALIIGS